MWKYRFIAILSVLAISIELLGITDSIKEYTVATISFIIFLLAMWLLSEAKEKNKN